MLVHRVHALKSFKIFSFYKKKKLFAAKNRFPYHSFFNLAFSFLSQATGGGGGVVRDEPVVDVEDDEEGGEAGDGHHVQDPRVVEQEGQAVLVFCQLVTISLMITVFNAKCGRDLNCWRVSFPSR